LIVQLFNKSFRETSKFCFCSFQVEELLIANQEKKERADTLAVLNEELLLTNATKDKFFSIIVHDLKSPFNSIVGYSKLLVKVVQAKDYNSIEKYAGIIEQSSNRAMDLLSNLMEWSLSQTGRMEFNPEYFEMISFINETVLLFDDIAGQKSISIVRNLPLNVPVFADKAMINTVLRNLISNAVKFTQPEGKIIISVEDKQNELIVSVSDTGIGISKERIDKLFNIRNGNSTPGTQNEKGTGLGLILCKEFTNRNNGKIWVESKANFGTTFYFSLPLPRENR
jgi:signal transduction histidine kinase